MKLRRLRWNQPRKIKRKWKHLRNTPGKLGSGFEQDLLKSPTIETPSGTCFFLCIIHLPLLAFAPEASPAPNTAKMAKLSPTSIPCIQKQEGNTWLSKNRTQFVFPILKIPKYALFMGFYRFLDFKGNVEIICPTPTFFFFCRNWDTDWWRE